ncbi:NAD(P)H-hydrate dehydratase [Parahaliea mediterranea]|uniref:Bifunctional NAD(P)H-hydrate repair enzyme n=1 Tax=Parahaliea mediterranea TaxID=651086 RepID=A0A939DCI9_9GAMM|nr:NAD(P)H-hydrate dehydratase [Parahaliea mediterranea]MBN7795559.1 NAD(P)H-hydrate dehydratase [Parahaliea mediterranea]
MFDFTQMQGLYTARQVRALDARAIGGAGIPGPILMARAAAAAWDQLLALWPRPELVQVLCGTGNNGGDGFLLAELAHKRGYPVAVYQLGDPARIGGDALKAREQALASGVPVAPYTAGCLESRGVVVDAMLGTGLGGEVRDAQRGAIEAVNTLDLPVLAVDIPSGLCADSGRVLGAAVRAATTVTFIAAKRGLYTGDGQDCAGAVSLATLSVPAAVYAVEPPDCRRLSLDAMLAALPPRPANAHKGLYGRVLVAGGDLGMGGAIALAAEAALRCGAGLVSAATRAEHVPAILARSPEVMARGVASGQELASLLDGADVVALGPGLGQSPWSEQLFQAACEHRVPLVLDADALNLLGRRVGGVVPPRGNWILTPHPGEAARLLGCSTGEVQADRFAAARELQQRLGGVVVLKGNGTLVCDGEQVLLGDYGNPGMASGGMGDVLTGVIAALLAQGLAPVEAAALGVCLHGAAADRAAGAGQRGLLASDLAPHMRELLA